MEQLMTKFRQTFLLGAALIGTALGGGLSSAWAQGKIYQGPSGPTYGSAEQPAQVGPRQGNARPQVQQQRPSTEGMSEGRRGDDRRDRSSYDRGGRDGFADRDYDRRGGYRGESLRGDRW